jgi:hypothetical protein
MTRLRNVAVLTVIGLASLYWPQTAKAECSACEQAAATAAQKKDEVRQKQITYGSIGAGAIGVVTMIFMCLNAANKRGKALDGRTKRKKNPLDPDAPLPYDGPPEVEPPLV